MATEMATTIDSFSKRGFIRVKEAFSRSDANAMCEIIWGVFERKFGILRSDPTTWNRPFRKHPLNEIGHTPLFWSIFGDRLITAIDEILGEGGWTLPDALGDFLITFPNTDSWELPHDESLGLQGWHSDEGFVPGIMGFVFLNDVVKGGGGTLIISGSHRLPRAEYGAKAEPDDLGRKWKHRWEASRQCDWLKDLRKPGDPHARYRKFIETSTEVEGTELQVVELTGAAGDAVLCHPWLVHAVAPNACDFPRFMRTPRICGQRNAASSGEHGEPQERVTRVSKLRW